MEAAFLGITMSMVVAILGWAINMSSRLKVVESRHEDFMSLIEDKFEDVKERLERIEHKMWNRGDR